MWYEYQNQLYNLSLCKSIQLNRDNIILKYKSDVISTYFEFKSHKEAKIEFDEIRHTLLEIYAIEAGKVKEDDQL